MMKEIDLDDKNAEDESPKADAEEQKRWWKRGQSNALAIDLKVHESSLEDRANCCSIWMLSFLNPLLSLGARKVLDADDVGVPSQQDLAQDAYEKTDQVWRQQIAKAAAMNERVNNRTLKEPSIVAALLSSFGYGRILAAFLYYLVAALLRFVPVLILTDLVRFFESGADLDDWDGLVYPWVEVVGLGVIPWISSTLETRNQTIMAHSRVFLRSSLSTLVYRKSLRISPTGRAATSTGQVVNMMSNDINQMQKFLEVVGLTLVAPIQVILATVLIYQQVGNATWVGVGYMFFLMPTTAAVVAVVKKNRREVIRFSDLRVRVMNELLTGIRIVKFYAWERPFGRQVANLRDQELKALTKLAYVSALGFSFLVISAPIIQPILVFATFVKIEDQPLSASMAFTTVALFNIMRFPFVFMPIALVQYVQSVIALKRVVRYLCLPELTEYVQDGPPPSSEASNPDSPMAQPGSITIANGTFSWSDPNVAEPVQTVVGGAKDPATKNAGAEMSSEKEELKNTIPTLQNLNCQIGAGSLIAVVGPVGSGKSSFLSALLGEMEALEDSKVYMPDYNTHSLSYCAQTPWVINDTIQGNILFGRSFDAERYYQVLEDCALLDDLKILPAGDKTEIGERGINLSGGQKARVSLARALYSLDTKIVLMDDPLSAVDSQVSEHLFSRAILPSETTRILVTHHVHVLPQCDHILVFDKGQIQAQGTYDELIAMGVDFKDAVQTARTTPNTEKEEVKEEIKSPTQLDATKQVVAEREHDAKTGATLVEDEEREEGRVEGAAYIHYIKAGGVCTALCILLIQGIGRGLEITGSFWLAAWTDETATNDLTEADTTFYVGIYAVFGMIGIFAVAIRGVLMAQHRLRASRTLHQDLTQSILKAPVAFFDVTPLGRILNRFAADMDKVDIELTQFLTRGIDALFNVLGSICAIIAATKGTFLIPLVPLGIMYYWVQLWFRKTSTELQRITKIATSPIFADFSQTLSGTSTIRAYSAQSKFFDKSVKNYDKLNSSYLLVQLVGYWLALRLDIMGGLISAFIGAVAIATHFIPAGWLGLSLTYSIEITTYLKFVVQMVANIEGEMSSVERILNYSHQIEQESTTESAEVTDTASWPSDGALRFRNASMRYRNGPPVLRNLSFEIKPGEKIGICGRTGSGKSSLMVALFRICELAEGYIQLDEVDISKVDLETLRSNLSIIPQGPVLFSNTVKFNLDPTLTHDDETLWEALRKVGMEKTVSEMRGLEALVSEGGENFSQGQRQLICIARALMRNAQILVMDEATASIDNETDAMVQEMIAKHFAHCTILTIAHRLNTIMESDRILVLDDGEIVEFDTPRNLLQDANGQFFKLVEMSEQATNKE